MTSEEAPKKHPLKTMDLSHVHAVEHPIAPMEHSLNKIPLTCWPGDNSVNICFGDHRVVLDLATCGRHASHLLACMELAKPKQLDSTPKSVGPAQAAVAVDKAAGKS